MTKDHKVDLWIENPVMIMLILNKILKSNNNNNHNNNLKCKYKTIIILIKDKNKANKGIITIIEDISKEIINNKEEWWEEEDITIEWEMMEMGMVIIDSQEKVMTVLYMLET